MSTEDQKTLLRCCSDRVITTRLLDGPRRRWRGALRGVWRNTPTRLTRTMLLGFFLLLTACGGGSVSTAGASPTATPVSDLKGRIVFGRYDPAVDDFHLFLVNPDGTNETQLLARVAECPHWAPDGNTILVCVANPHGLIRPATLHLDGSGFALLDTPDPSLNLGCGTWSSGGARLVCGGWDDVHPTRTLGIFTVRSSDGGDLVQVTTNPYGGHDVPGNSSPDGTRIVFGREKPSLHQCALFVVDVNGSDLHQISAWQTANCESEPRWSPDGQWILTDNNEGRLYLVHPDGTDWHQIQLDMGDPDQHIEFQPSWSPDGTRIVFSLYRAGTAGNGDLYTVRADGTDPRPVTRTPGEREEFADWGTPSE